MIRHFNYRKWKSNKNYEKCKVKLKREASDRLPSHFKQIFTAWKSCQVMIEMLYKMHRSSRSTVITTQTSLKLIIFNRDSYFLYKFIIKIIY